MPELRRRDLLLVGGSLLLAAVSPWLPRSEKREPDSRLGLARWVPEQVGEWQLVELREATTSGGANEMLEAPYLGPDGALVQLTLEYGSDQRRAHELHYPHTCHRVRGDEVVLLPQAPLWVNPDLTLPTFVLEWRQPSSGVRAYCRFWLVVEGTPTVDIAALKWRQLANGVLGRPVSAVLVRIDLPTEESLSAAATARKEAVVSGFAVSLYGALAPDARRLLFGARPAAARGSAAVPVGDAGGVGIDGRRGGLGSETGSRSEGA